MPTLYPPSSGPWRVRRTLIRRLRRRAAAAAALLVCAAWFGADCGMIPDRTDDRGMTALMRAAAAGETAEVERLVERGAGVEQRVRAELVRELLAFLWLGPPPPARDPGYTALHFAVRDGHIETVRALLAGGVRLQDRDDPPGLSPLDVAVVHPDVPPAMVLLLLERGHPANPAPGASRLTPLHVTAERGTPEVVAALLRAGADLDARDGEGMTPLIRSVRAGRPEVAAVLLDAGADPEILGGPQRWTALSWAEAGRNPALTELLRGRGASEATEANRRLGEAVRRRDTDAARVALAEGADARAPGPFGDALLADALSGPPELVRLLLEAGAEQPPKGRGSSLLELALARGSFEAAELLVEFGADPSAAGLATAAAQRGSVEWLRRIVEAGGDPEEASGAPLRAGARSGKAAAVRYLLELGVDPNVPDEHGREPLGQAVVGGDAEAVRLLLEGGAAVDGRPDGWTPLMDATLSGKVALARLLLAHGADPTLRTFDGRTVLELARASRAPGMEAVVVEALGARQP